jgi:hypothetical protein
MKRASLAAIALAAVVAVFLLLRRGTPEPSSAPTPAGAHRENAPSAAAPPPPATSAAPDLTEAQGQALANAVAYPLDLEWLRAKIPHNLYWKLGAPTSDVAVAKRRAEHARRSNEDFGRIQANEASAPQIQAYYAERRQLSRDYLELAALVLAEKGQDLPERDRGLFELSANLHRQRLVQIDRDEQDALKRLRARAASAPTPEVPP